MDESRIITLLERLGCRRIITRGDWVRSSCPDEHHHQGGMDRNPSFGITINPDGKSRAYCHACGLHDSAEWIAKQRGHEDLVLPVHVQVNVETHMKRGANKRAFGLDREPTFLPPESALGPFQGTVPRYLLERGLTKETCKAWELGYDKEIRRAIFTIRDSQGRLRTVAGRDLGRDPKIKYNVYIWDKANECLAPWYDYDRYEDFISIKKNPVLYGEHKVEYGRREDEYGNALIVVEGYLHVLWLWQLGFTAVATMGSKVSDVQADIIVELAPQDGPVIVMADGDDAGKDHMESLREKVAGRTPTFGVRCPDGNDAADGSEREIVELLGERKVLLPESGSHDPRISRGNFGGHGEGHAEE